MARIIILLVILPLIVAHVEVRKTTYKKKCPTFDKIANFSNPDELGKVQNKVMEDLWANEYPELTDLGEDLVDVLYDMLESRVPFWKRYALAVTEWIWVYLPDMDKNLNFCSFADIINATVNFENNQDCHAILKSINTTTTEFQFGGARLIDNIVENAGCGDVYTSSPTPPPPPKCYEDGFVYNIEEIWDGIGWEYPCSLKEIVLELYNSGDNRDKIMALLATSVLSKYVAVLETGYPPEVLYKLLTMFTYGKVPKYCCKKFIKITKTVGESMGSRNPDIFKSARDLTGCYDDY